MKCQFNAKELLVMRRRVAASSVLPIASMAAIIRAIDEVRWQHEELTNCRCWNQAIAGEENLFPVGGKLV
jgi:hypothetical protein